MNLPPEWSNLPQIYVMTHRTEAWKNEKPTAHSAQIDHQLRI